jgi:hypothetical protein
VAVSVAGGSNRCGNYRPEIGPVSPGDRRAETAKVVQITARGLLQSVICSGPYQKGKAMSTTRASGFCRVLNKGGLWGWHDVVHRTFRSGYESKLPGDFQ